MKSSAEISQEVSNQENVINDYSKARDQIKIAINSLRREIHQKQIEIKNLEDNLIKAECLVREAKTQHSILKDEFWRAKESGL
jgi:uncharacterized coiled-coil DUF342 family protein